MRRSRMRGVLAGLCGLALAGSMAAAAPSAIAGPAASHMKVWSPFPVPTMKSVPGHPLATGAGRAARAALRVREPAGVAVREYRPLTRPAWPAARNETVSLARTGVVQAPGEPVWLGDAGMAQPRLALTVASHAAAARAGVSGMLMRLAPAGSTPSVGTRTGTSVIVRVGYGGFAANFGGGWASRLRLVEMPACALTTPGAAACRRQVPVASRSDPSASDITAKLAVPAAGIVLATASAPAGAEGDYTATSLKPSGTWAIQQGDFTYSYPITVPPAIGGSAPTVKLAYDSQSVDSETSGTNAQSSWIGDGWNYSPGFIERSYKPCSRDGISGSGDLCWGGYNAVLSLGAHSSVIVRDDSTGTWHLRNDDGSSVQELDGASNGMWNGEYWLVTTTDGTKYYFGLNHLPGGPGSDPGTNSAWGVPVYNPSSGDPCNTSSAGASSWCQMGYRWNLDYVVDPHGNLTVYNYATETNYYQRGGGQGTGTLTKYVRAGYPVSVSYGYLLSDAIKGASPGAQVLFGTSQRCLTSSAFPDCSYSNLSASTASNWPDVPYDQNCGSAGTCSVDSPTFWSTVRLTSITTQALEGTAYHSVDSYTLTQSFPDAGGASQPVMFLNSIQHTGQDGTAVTLPPMTFTPTEIDNRVDGLVPAAEPLYRPRIATITTEYGAGIAVTYAPPACSRVNNTMPASADTNTMPCFPVYWTPAGESSPILDWFNKSLVKEVTTADETGTGSPVQVTNYSYLGGAAWHQDESTVVDAAHRTWDQYRGYAQVEVTTGAAPDPVTETVTTYLRGMNGDPTASGGTQPVSVSDSLGDSVPDDDWLAGQPLEVDTYSGLGGSVRSKAISGPFTFKPTASQAMPGSLPPLTAELPQSTESRTLSLLASGSWRTVETDTAFNSDGQVIRSDSKGDGTASDPEICTTTAYATSSANPMMESYPSEIRAIAGPCGTTPTAANTVSDTRDYYDEPGNGSLTSMGTFGVITGGGAVTGTQVISGYDSAGNPQFRAKSATSYDEYGRSVSVTDANANVTTTAYTPATGALPAATVVTNPKGWKTTTTLDPARDLPLTVTDPNDEVTTETYDALGRATEVWLPGRAITASADDTFAYSVTGTAPPTITSSTLREDGSYASNVQVFDGLMQLRQDQATPLNAAAGRVITDTFYDSHGWTVKASDQYYDSTTPPNGVLFVADDNQVPGQTATQYDGQGRPVASVFYSLGTQQWQSTTAYPGADETDMTPPPGGTATTTFTNALGETTASWSYADSATPTGKAADARVTSYAYTPAGQVASITDNAGNKWAYTYDLLGNKIAQTDPDTGQTTFGYDADGNLTSSKDANGNTLLYTYDVLNRKTAEYSGSISPGNELASWTYDTLAKGQITSSTAYAGGATSTGSAYTEAITGYDDAYQPTGTSLTIPPSEDALSEQTYTTSSSYSPVTHELQSTSYSADAGLPAEKVNYTYDLGGLLSSADGTAPYLDMTLYSPLGQVQRTTSGTYGQQFAVTSSYDEGTQRLLQTTQNVQTGSSATDVINYTYNDAGSITSTSDTQSGGATDTQCFGYNYLSELVTAWTDTAGTSTEAAPSVAGIGGCKTTTPSAATIGGPAPYWQSWTYDSLGDRTSQTTHDPSGNSSGDITQALSYPGSNGATAASDPSAVSTVTTSSAGGTTTTSYSYDNAGDVTARASASTGSAPPAGPSQTIGYNQQDQVDSVTPASGGAGSSYVYDADGNLLIQRDPGVTYLYLDGGAETLSLAGGTVSGVRYYPEPDGTTVVRSSSGTLSYEAANQQNTNTTSVNASTLALTRRYYDPYGNPRGSVPSNWVDNRGFLDQPADTSTGLDLLGARQYDSATGRFLSVDPLLEAGDTRQMGGYAYAADNPVGNSDPGGQVTAPAPGGDPPVPPQAGPNPPPVQASPNPPPAQAGPGGGDGGGGGNGDSGGCYGPGGEWQCGDPTGGFADGSGCWGPGSEWLCDSATHINEPPPPPVWNPPKPAPVATRYVDPMVCAKDGPVNGACATETVPADSGGDSLGSDVSWLFRKSVHVAAQVNHAVSNFNGLTDTVNCISSPSAGTCLSAAAKIGNDAFIAATLGTGAAAEASAEGAAVAAGDVAATSAGDVAAATAADGAASAGRVATRWRLLQRVLEPCMVAVMLACGGGAVGDPGAALAPVAMKYSSVYTGSGDLEQEERLAEEYGEDPVLRVLRQRPPGQEPPQ
jgi:RHS repeat-associated protein